MYRVQAGRNKQASSGYCPDQWSSDYAKESMPRD